MTRNAYMAALLASLMTWYRLTRSSAERVARRLSRPPSPYPLMKLLIRRSRSYHATARTTPQRSDLAANLTSVRVVSPVSRQHFPKGAKPPKTRTTLTKQE